MPAQYEAIRDSLVKKGVPLADAKTQAAKIYNSQRPKNAAPVTRNYQDSKARKLLASKP